MVSAPVEEWVPGEGPRAPLDEPEPEPADHQGRMQANWFSGHPVMRQGRQPTPPWTPAKVVGYVLVVLAVALLFVALVLSGILYVQGTGPPETLTRGELVLGAVANLVWFVVPPFVYVAAFYGGGWEAFRWRLLLRSDHMTRDVAIGIGAAIGFVLAGVAVLYVLELVGVSTENPVVEALGPQLTWPIIVLVSLSAGISEEVFFRGFLQGRIGIVPANLLFGLAHMDYGTPLQVILPMGLGFLFSWLALRTRSLYPAIIAHVGFDLIMLSLTKLASDYGWDAMALV